jgi:hypothetical protein
MCKWMVRFKGYFGGYIVKKSLLFVSIICLMASLLTENAHGMKRATPDDETSVDETPKGHSASAADQAVLQETSSESEPKRREKEASFVPVAAIPAPSATAQTEIAKRDQTDITTSEAVQAVGASGTELARMYGNKYTNLVRLQEKIVKNGELTQKLDQLGGYTVAVPPFTGLSDEQGQEFLRKQEFDVTQAWRSKSGGELSSDGSPEISEKIKELEKEEERLAHAISKPVPMLKLMALKKFAEDGAKREQVFGRG